MIIPQAKESIQYRVMTGTEQSRDFKTAPNTRKAPTKRISFTNQFELHNNTQKHTKKTATRKYGSTGMAVVMRAQDPHFQKILQLTRSDLENNANTRTLRKLEQSGRPESRKHCV